VLPVTTPDADAQALRLLWARQRIRQLSDEEALRGGSSQREAITTLGLQHSLLTQYTSFIAVDHVVRALDADNRVAVQQPSPLPQGVSNLAVGTLGTAVPSTPEPATWLALLLALALATASVARARRSR
jgi:Ca-activated chloride channel family protein